MRRKRLLITTFHFSIFLALIRLLLCDTVFGEMDIRGVQLILGVTILIYFTFYLHVYVQSGNSFLIHLDFCKYNCNYLRLSHHNQHHSNKDIGFMVLLPKTCFLGNDFFNMFSVGGESQIDSLCIIQRLWHPQRNQEKSQPPIALVDYPKFTSFAYI